jgi:hypothetical protein
MPVHFKFPYFSSAVATEIVVVVLKPGLIDELICSLSALAFQVVLQTFFVREALPALQFLIRWTY